MRFAYACVHSCMCRLLSRMRVLDISAVQVPHTNNHPQARSLNATTLLTDDAFFLFIDELSAMLPLLNILPGSQRNQTEHKTCRFKRLILKASLRPVADTKKDAIPRRKSSPSPGNTSAGVHFEMFSVSVTRSSKNIFIHTFPCRKDEKTSAGAGSTSPLDLSHQGKSIAHIIENACGRTTSTPDI